jgi:hypothetical protein
LLFQNIQAYASITVNIGVVNFGLEIHLPRAKATLGVTKYLSPLLANSEHQHKDLKHWRTLATLAKSGHSAI